MIITQPPRYQARLVTCGRLAGLALLLVFEAGCGRGVGQLGTDFHEDFRNKGLSELKMFPSYTGADDFMKPGPDGLRIALPETPVPTRYRETGLCPPFDIQGDFEIVAGYETLQVDEGQGATFEIYLQTQPGEALAFHRTFDSAGRGGFFITRLTTINGKRQDMPGVRTTTPVNVSSKLGQLRIARVGGEAGLSCAEGGGDFRELFHVPLGTEDVVRFRVGVNPRGARFAEARLVDLRVKGQLIANGKALEVKSLPRRTALWVVAGLAALGLGLGGLWTWTRKKAMARRARGALLYDQAQANVAARPIEEKLS